MKKHILWILLLPLSVCGQDEPPKAPPVGGYNTTIHNPNYGKGYLDPETPPSEELQTVYPHPSYGQVGGKDGANPNPSQTGGDFSAAKAQAIYWLSLLDQKAYPASWMQAGGLLQDIVGRNVWAAAMQSVRGSLGNNTGRKVGSHQTLSQLPHGTRGTFMKISFDSSFTSKSSVKETVIMMASGKGGQWKVISYSIGQ